MNHPTVSITPYDDVAIGSADPYGGLMLPIQSEFEIVKGDMLVVQKKFLPSEIEKSYSQSFVEGLKKEMALELAERILQNKYVEFTKQEDLKNGEVVYRARVYVTPDDQIRKIRKSEK